MANHKWFGDTPFRTASMFSTACFNDRFIRGLGGHWMDYNHRFIDRLQSQRDPAPIQGGRVFIEAMWTGGHAFFNEERSASERMWNYNQLRHGQRPGLDTSVPALTVHMQKHLLWLVKLARQHDFKIECVVDSTMKHTDGVGWNVIGQCIRQTAAFLRLVHIAKWDTGVDGNAIGHPTNDRANEAIRKLFEEVKGPIDHLVAVETHNEWDAHSLGAWQKDGLDRAKALTEVNLQLSRMKRVKDGEPEQWPEGAVWVSHGGRDDIEYDPTHADAVAIHPSRPGTRVGDRFHDLRKYHKPIYANEILHYIDPSMWYLVENETFRPGSSTKNTSDRLRFVDEMMADGMWVCEHSLTNMSNGRWKDEDVDYEEMPLDAYERARGASLHDVPTPPEPPEPPTPPEPPVPPQRRKVIQGEIVLSGPVGFSITLGD